jgi:NADH dehydrogenase FAD-containing subunit
VTEQSVKVADKDGREADIPFGACVWSTGIGMHPLVNQLKDAFPAVQTHNRYGGHIWLETFHRQFLFQRLCEEPAW